MGTTTNVVPIDGTSTAESVDVAMGSVGHEAGVALSVDASPCVEEQNDADEIASEAPNQRQLSFLGLVLTKMREKDLSSSEVERRFSSAAAFQDEFRNVMMARLGDPEDLVDDSVSHHPAVPDQVTHGDRVDDDLIRAEAADVDSEMVLL